MCKSLINSHADVLSGARGLNFGLILYVHVHSYFVYMSSEGSGEHTVKPVLRGHSKRRPKICFQD